MGSAVAARPLRRRALRRDALRRDELDVVTMHGKMQIDEFSSPYQWEATTLVFTDPDKDVRYEVRIGARKGAR